MKSLGLLEGNQQAIESFRNNMSVAGAPKPDPALVLLVEAIEKYKESISYMPKMTISG